jgi:hypothetical protein
MPVYSFKERFVPFILNGSKPHTIRKRRKYPAKPGDTLYLYFGLRTKYSKKLREEKCLDVKTIYIKQKAICIAPCRLSDYQIDLLRNKKLRRISFKYLTIEECDRLAWMDGFRPEGSTLKNPKGSFELMYRWWKQTHDLPFIGDIIYWDPKDKT